MYSHKLVHNLLLFFCALVNYKSYYYRSVYQQKTHQKPQFATGQWLLSEIARVALCRGVKRDEPFCRFTFGPSSSFSGTTVTRSTGTASSPKFYEAVLIRVCFTYLMVIFLTRSVTSCGFLHVTQCVMLRFWILNFGFASQWMQMTVKIQLRHPGCLQPI